MKNGKVNPWFFVSVGLFVLLVSGALYFCWICMYPNGELQKALTGTRSAQTKLSQVEYTLGNIIERNIELIEERRKLKTYILRLEANRKKRDKNDRKNESIIRGFQAGLKECIRIVKECNEGIERSRGYLTGVAE